MVLCGRHYATANDLKRFVSSMLHKYDCGQIIEKDDEEILMQLFNNHPSSAEKMEDFNYLTVGQHKGDMTTSRCFLIVSCYGKRTDISYLKCIDQLVLKSKPQRGKLSLLAEQYASLLARLAQDKLVEDKLLELVTASCSRINIPQIPFAIAMVKLSIEVPCLSSVVMPAAIQLAVAAESSRRPSKALLAAIAESLNSSAFSVFLSAFETYILPSTALPLTGSLLLAAKQLPSPCSFNDAFASELTVSGESKGLANSSAKAAHSQSRPRRLSEAPISWPEKEEEFLSLLINKMFALEHVPQAAAYLVSFLSKTTSHILVPAASYLLKFTKKSIARKETRLQGYCVLKYLCYLCCAQPLVLEEIAGELQRLFKSKKINIKKVPFDYSVDPSPLLDRLGFKGFAKREELELPFRRCQTQMTPTKHRRTDDAEALNLETEESDTN